MNKNLLYLALLVLLAFLTYYFVFNEKKDGFDQSETNFSVKHIEDIQTIFLTNLEGDKIKLSKVDHEWMANDTVEIIQQKVDALLEALRDQQAIQPVRLGSHDQVIKSMSSHNTKVEVYTSKGKTNTFYVATITAPNNLSYMLTEGAKRPYIVKLPLQNLFLALRYSADIKEWRSRKIMHAKPDEIEMIDIAYKDSFQYSFHLVNETGKTPSVTGKQIIDKPLNLKRVNSYLSLWDSIYCYGFEMRNRIKDTILTQGKEIATVTLKKKNKPVQTLVLYFKPVSQGTKAMLKVGNQKYDFDVFMGFLNQKDLIAISRTYAQIMLRYYPEFYELDK